MLISNIISNYNNLASNKDNTNDRHLFYGLQGRKAQNAKTMSVEHLTKLMRTLTAFYASLPVTNEGGQAMSALAHAADLYKYGNQKCAQSGIAVHPMFIIDLIQQYDQLLQHIQINHTSNIDLNTWNM